MAPDATGDAAEHSEPAVFGAVTKDYLRMLGGTQAGESEQGEERVHRLAARCILAGVTVTGACIAVGTVTPTTVSWAPRRR